MNIDNLVGYAASLSAWFVAIAVLLVHFFTNQRRHTAIDCLVIFAVALLLTASSDYTFGYDDSQYLIAAMNLVSGKGIVDAGGTATTARLGYVVIHAVAYEAGGTAGAALVPSLFVSAFAVLIYLVGARTYARTVGAAAAILVIALPRMIDVDVDAGVSIPILLAYLVLTAPPRRRDIAVGALGGLLIAAAQSIKEIGFLFIGFPTLLLLIRWDPRLDRRLISSIATATLLIAALLITGRYIGSLEPTYFSSVQATLSASIAIFSVPSVLKGLIAYFAWPGHSSALLNFLPAIAILPFALASAARRGYFGAKTDSAILAAAAVWLPLLSFTGLRDWRPEQGLVFLGLALIIIAAYLHRSLLKKPMLFGAAVFTLAFAALLESLFIQNLYVKYYQTSPLGALLALKKPTIRYHFQGGPELAAYGRTVPHGSRIWSTAPLAGISASAASGDTFWVRPVPVHALVLPGAKGGRLQFTEGWISEVDRPIWAVYALPEVNSPLFILYRDEMKAGFEQVFRVFLAAQRWPWVGPLETLLSGRLLVETDRTAGPEFSVSIYAWKADDFARNVNATYLTRDALLLLKQLRSSDPALLEGYLSEIRKGHVDLAAANIDELLDRCPAEAAEALVRCVP